ncbi:MAG: esterase-like activity of phytase family protein [Betaproteobacteria bacterium]
MRRRSSNRTGRWLWLVCLLVSLLAVAAAFTGLASGPRPDSPLTVAVTPVPLDPRDPGRDRLGALRFRGGLWLRSVDPRFGGLSDLRISADGRLLRAVSDCGRGLTATLSYGPDGRLQGLSEPRMIDLVGPDGQALQLGERDSESLDVHGGALEVGFEGKPRIWAYALEPPFAGPAHDVPAPPGLAGCGSNGGIETMAMVDDSRRLLVCETRRGASLDVPAWIGNGDGWLERRYPLVFRGGWADEPFRPTGATLLPGGDVLVLERRFPPIGSRIVRLARADLEGRDALHPREIAAIEAPLTVDNFEGVDAREDAAGRTLVYLVSDDNDCAKLPGARRGPALQRTLLLMFSLEG